MKEERIKIDEALADKYNGRCFQDLDDSSWLGGFMFEKTETGIDMHLISCNFYSGNIDTLHNDYGEYKYKDTYCGYDIQAIESGSPFIREISRNKYNSLLSMVKEKMKEEKRLEDDFKNAREKWERMK